MSEIIKKDDLDGQLKVTENEGFSTSHFLPARGVISKNVMGARDEAAQMIAEARVEAQRILAQVRQMKEAMIVQVEQERKQGYDLGYQEGLGEVSEMIAQASVQREKLLQDAEPEIVQMVFQIAEKILGNAVAQGAVVSVVKQALQEAIGERLTVRVNPNDLDKIREAEPELQAALQNIKSLNTVADDAIEPGGCAVDTEVGTIDAQLSTQLAAIKKSLGLGE